MKRKNINKKGESSFMLLLKLVLLILTVLTITYAIFNTVTFMATGMSPNQFNEVCISEGFVDSYYLEQYCIKRTYVNNESSIYTEEQVKIKIDYDKWKEQND